MKLQQLQEARFYQSPAFVEVEWSTESGGSETSVVGPFKSATEANKFIELAEQMNEQAGVDDYDQPIIADFSVTELEDLTSSADFIESFRNDYL